MGRSQVFQGFAALGAAKLASSECQDRELMSPIEVSSLPTAPAPRDRTLPTVSVIAVIVVLTAIVLAEPASGSSLSPTALPGPQSDSPNPEVEVRLSDPRPTPEEPFFLEVELRWTGAPDALLPHPPELSLPDGLEAGSVEASTWSGREQSVTVYRMHLTAVTAGTYVLDPVELRWTPHGQSEARSLRVAGPTLQVSDSLAQGLATRGVEAPSGLPGGGTGAAALLGLLIFSALLWSWWRSGRLARTTRRASGETPQARRDRAEIERLEELFRQARKLRLERMPRDAVDVLDRIQQALDGSKDRRDDRREIVSPERLQEIRYGASLPTGPELDGWERRLAQELEARRPNPSQAERESLRMRPTVR